MRGHKGTEVTGRVAHVSSQMMPSVCQSVDYFSLCFSQLFTSSPFTLAFLPPKSVKLCKFKTMTYDKHSINYAAGIPWNSIHVDIKKNTDNVNVFKIKIRN